MSASHLTRIAIGIAVLFVLMPSSSAAQGMTISVHASADCTGVTISSQNVAFGNCIAGTDGKSSAKFFETNATYVKSYAYKDTICGTLDVSGDVPYGLCFSASGVYLKFIRVTAAPTTAGSGSSATTTAAGNNQLGPSPGSPGSPGAASVTSVATLFVILVSLVLALLI